MKRLITLSLSFVVLMTAVLTMSSCFGRSLPDGFEADKVREQAENAVQLLSDGQYDEVVEMFSPELRAELNAEELESALGGQLEALGAYTGVKSVSMGGAEAGNIGEYVVAVMACTYENGSAIFTISVNSDYQLCGLYMR